MLFLFVFRSRYWVTNLLATTVGDSQEKSVKTSKITSTSPLSEGTAASDLVYVMPYVKADKKGLLIVNKKSSGLDLTYDIAPLLPFAKCPTVQQ